MATAKGPLFSEQAQGTIGDTLVYSTSNDFQRVTAKKLKYKQIKHRYFDNQTLIQWAAGCINQYPQQMESIYKPLAAAAGLPLQAFMMKRLKECLKVQTSLKLPTNTLGTYLGTVAARCTVIKTKTKIIVATPPYPSISIDGWIITFSNSTVNYLNRTQVAGYTERGTWSTTEWWPNALFRISAIAIDSQNGTWQGNRFYTTVST
jgi:hypothetical protein